MLNHIISGVHIIFEKGESEQIWSAVYNSGLELVTRSELQEPCGFTRTERRAAGLQEGFTWPVCV